MAINREAAESIETLLERLQTSTLLEDRRDACRGLLAYARNYRVEVGAQAMEPLLQVIRDNRHDLETVNYCMDSLNCIISGQLADRPAATWPDSTVANHDVGYELSEIFLKHKENVHTIVETIQEEDCKTRWLAVRILCGLARSKLERIQDCILSSPGTIERLTQLIGEERELIRNDAIVLFVKLTRSNQDIQKILAGPGDFFDRMLKIIILEGYLSGAVAVVNDSISIIYNLLYNNEANQIIFCEVKHLEKLVPFFDNDPNVQWTLERADCVMSVLHLIDVLISPLNQIDNVRRYQELMQQCGLLDVLCELSSTSLPRCVYTETMKVSSSIVRGHSESIAGVVMQESPMKPILVLGMVKEMCQDLEKRISELYDYIHVLHNFMTHNFTNNKNTSS